MVVYFDSSGHFVAANRIVNNRAVGRVLQGGEIPCRAGEGQELFLIEVFQNAHSYRLQQTDSCAAEWLSHE